MRLAFCFLSMAAAVCAQATTKLDSDLSALARPGAPIASIATRIADDILALAEKDAQPSRQTTLDFSVELSKALTGKRSSAEKVQAVSDAMLLVIQSSGVPSARFHSAIEQFRAALIALDASPLDARSAANRLMILGQEVRGPEDIHLKDLHLLKQR